MTCREFIAFLDEYFSGEQSAEVRVEFDRHLSLCEDCRTYLQTYDATIKLVRALGDTPDNVPPADVPEDLVRAILAARRTPPN